MAIVGSRPETGLRIDVSRLPHASAPWRYEGDVVTSDSRFAVVATLSIDADVSVELPAFAPESLADRIRLIVRAAYKHSRDDGRPPPWRIVRWRPDA